MEYKVVCLGFLAVFQVPDLFSRKILEACMTNFGMFRLKPSSWCRVMTNKSKVYMFYRFARLRLFLVYSHLIEGFGYVRSQIRNIHFKTMRI